MKKYKFVVVGSNDSAQAIPADNAMKNLIDHLTDLRDSGEDMDEVTVYDISDPIDRIGSGQDCLSAIIRGDM